MILQSEEKSFASSRKVLVLCEGKESKEGWVATTVSFDLTVQHDALWIEIKEEMINKMRIL